MSRFLLSGDLMVGASS
ncbi:LEPR-XLL domain-containing protein [Sessilibacter sp. MAH3]